MTCDITWKPEQLQNYALGVRVVQYDYDIHAGPILNNKDPVEVAGLLVLGGVALNPKL